MSYDSHIFPYEWNLKDIVFTKDKGKVFSCFSCGGGSSLGYKLAGFDVIGCNEIDKKLFDIYCENNHPQFAYNEDIRLLKNRNNLPKELYNLDILDGSPPCSTFSMAGNREKDWGKEKKFREGQVSQVLDTLFFDFIDLAKKLQPKVVIAENVKGLLLGKAKTYVGRILEEFDKANYEVNYFLLNASLMGVPQRRERVFFIGIRKDLAIKIPKKQYLFGEYPYINMNFNEAPVYYKEIENKDHNYNEKIFPFLEELYDNIKEGESFSKGKNKYFSYSKVSRKKVLATITAHTNGGGEYHYLYHRPLDKRELTLGQSFPLDFNFMEEHPKYVLGMSVPPIMMAQIARRIDTYWISKLK